MALSQTHRSTLKQKNKKHNILGHRTKGQLAAQNKGRIAVKEITKRHKNELSRNQRKHQAKQIRAHKRDEALFKKRMIGSAKAPPFLVTIIPLSPSINTQKIIGDLVECDACLTSHSSPQGLQHISCRRFKQRFSFISPPINDLFAVLDCIKVSTNVIFVWEAEGELGDAENLVLSSIFAQGMPSALHVVYGLDELSSKKKNFALKALQKEVAARFPEHAKLHSMETSQDVFLLLRQIGAQKQRSVFYKEQRSHLVAEKVLFEGDGNSGKLKVYGYLRGQSLSANSLVHVPGWGEFQISRIESINDPYPLEAHKRSPLQEMPEEPRLLEEPDPELQENLITENEIDPMEGEQTWPTEEELKEAAEERKFEPKVKMKRVPRGTSDYQAAWILDSEDEEEESLAEDDDAGGPAFESEDAVPPLCETPPGSDSEDGAEDDDCETLTMTDVDENEYDRDVDYDSDMNAFEKIKAARDDACFPDEMDTPMDVEARVRFQKFRGLQSFRASHWDPKENLPLDYSRIFQFKNYNHARKRLYKTEKEGAFVGWYICVHLNDVPRHLYKENLVSGSPLVFFSLLPHEQKMSLLNVAIKSHPHGHTTPIRSKDRLIFHVGCRRFANAPVFSEHSTGDKHKFMRYFQPGDTTVASMFAPITFSPCNVSVYKKSLDGSRHDLVATGSVLSANPNRIICKRVVLSGHPFKVNRKSAVVRYMFFNRADVNWFKPVELRTKWGKRGHIKEPLGTHGHMKCVFNGQLKSQDTVLMNLYKRVFPKWRYDPFIVDRPSLYAGGAAMESEQQTEDESEEEEQEIIQQKSKRKKVHFQIR